MAFFIGDFDEVEDDRLVWTEGGAGKGDTEREVNNRSDRQRR